MGGRSGDICFNILNYIVNCILNSEGDYERYKFYYQRGYVSNPNVIINRA